MANTPQYFDSPDIIKLIIGQENKELHVPRSVLEQIPFFSNALKGDQYREAIEKVVRMPEDNPKAVSDLLHFVFADHVKPIERAAKDIVTEEEREAVKAYIRAFVVADKFMAEYTANRILDQLWNYHDNYDVDLDLFSMLRAVSLQESRLYEFLADTLVEEMRLAAKRNKCLRQQLFGKPCKESHLFDNMMRDDATLLLNKLSTPADNVHPWRQKCDIHTHTTTPKCSESFSNDFPDDIGYGLFD